MGIHKDGLKVKILSYLANQPYVKRCSFIDIFSDYSHNVVRSSVRYLLDNDMVEESQKYLDGKHKVRVLSLAEKGRDYLRTNIDSYQIYSQKDSFSHIRSASRREVVSKVHNLLRTYGVLLGEDRPPLAVLSGREEIREEDIEKASSMQEHGAFYDITEIRNESAILFGEGPLNQTRCLGAMVRKRRVYLIYNMQNKLIVFNQSVEERARDIILRLFRSRHKERSSCVLFGSSGTTLFKLLYSNPRGLHPAQLQSNNQGSMAYIMKTKISLKKMAALFSEIYFIPTRKNKEPFELSTYLSKQEMQGKVAQFIRNKPDLRPEESLGGIQGRNTKNDHGVFVWLDNDILSLYQLFRATGSMRDSSIEVITTSTQTAEICSRLLGTKFASAYSLMDEQIVCSRYDNHGQKI